MPFETTDDERAGTRASDEGATRGAAAGTDLHYRALGPTRDRTRAVVLLHADNADSRMWDGVFERLARHHHTVRYDRRGYGASPAAVSPFAHPDDLIGLLDVLGLERAHLVGCSDGGAIALDTALAAPERVATLTLVSSALGGHDFEGPPPPLLLALFAALAQRDREQAAELAVQLWAVGPKRAPADVGTEVRERLRGMSPAALGQFAAAVQPSAPERTAAGHLHDISAPTLVVTGALDDDAVLAVAERLLAEIVGVESAVFEDCAHMVPMERPERFAAVVSAFVSRHER